MFLLLPWQSGNFHSNLASPKIGIVVLLFEEICSVFVLESKESYSATGSIVRLRDAAIGDLVYLAEVLYDLLLCEDFGHVLDDDSAHCLKIILQQCWNNSIKRHHILYATMEMMGL